MTALEIAAWADNLIFLGLMFAAGYGLSELIKSVGAWWSERWCLHRRQLDRSRRNRRRL